MSGRPIRGALVFSVLLHVILVMLYVGFKPTSKSGTESPEKRFKITLQSSPESTLTDLQHTTEGESIPLLNERIEIPEVITQEQAQTESQPDNIIQKTSPPQTVSPSSSKPVQRKSLSSAITSVIETDAQDFGRQIEQACERRGAYQESGCISRSEQLLGETSDPFGFGKALNQSLGDGPGLSARQRKLLESRLALVQSELSNLKNTSGKLKEQLLNQYANELRQDLIYAECGGAFATGKCSGEIKLGAIVNALKKLF